MVRDLIYKYMVSPEDALITFDTKRTGGLTFGDFSKMMHSLLKQAKMSASTGTELEDLFGMFGPMRGSNAGHFVRAVDFIRALAPEEGDEKHSLSDNEVDRLAMLLTKHRNLIVESIQVRNTQHTGP